MAAAGQEHETHSRPAAHSKRLLCRFVSLSSVTQQQDPTPPAAVCFLPKVQLSSVPAVLLPAAKPALFSPSSHRFQLPPAKYISEPHLQQSRYFCWYHMLLFYTDIYAFSFCFPSTSSFCIQIFSYLTTTFLFYYFYYFYSITSITSISIALSCPIFNHPAP